MPLVQKMNKNMHQFAMRIQKEPIEENDDNKYKTKDKVF